MTSQQHWIDRAVVITGASSGIGEACALELDRRGWRVFAGVRSDEAAAKLHARASERLVAVHIDVTDPDGLAAAARTVESAVAQQTRTAGLRGLLNNAGIVVPGPLELVPLEQLRRQFEVNVIGQVAAIQAFLPLLRAGRGRIVNMGSVSGRMAVPFLGPYSASKYALEALSDSLRLELRRWGIAVSIVEPASIKTPIWEKTRKEVERAGKEMQAKAEELYGEGLAAFRAQANRQAQNGLPVETVVRAVVRALTVRHPKARYPVGIQTKWAIIGKRFLSDRAFDAIVRSVMGLR